MEGQAKEVGSTVQAPLRSTMLQPTPQLFSWSREPTTLTCSHCPDTMRSDCQIVIQRSPSRLQSSSKLIIAGLEFTCAFTCFVVKNCTRMLCIGSTAPDCPFAWTPSMSTSCDDGSDVCDEMLGSWEAASEMLSKAGCLCKRTFVQKDHSTES